MNPRLGRLSIAGLLALHLGWAFPALAAPTLGPLGRVTEGSPACQQEPIPAPLRSGGFAVAWNHVQEERTLLRIADAEGRLPGRPISFADRQVRVMGSDAEGRLVLIWRVESTQAYRLQRLTAGGNPLGLEVDLPIPGSLLRVGGVVAPDGSFVLTWQTEQRLVARWFSPQGAPLGSEIEIDRYSIPFHSLPPAAAIDTAGNLAVAWSRPTQPAPELRPRVSFRRFDVTGKALGPRVEVSAGEPNRTSEWIPEIAALREGGIAVAWQNDRSFPNEPGQSIRLRLFNADDDPFSSTIEASEGKPGFWPRLSSDGHRIALVWQSGLDRKGRLRLMTSTDPGESPIPFHPESLLGNDGSDDESPVAAFLTSGRIGVVWAVRFDTGFIPTECQDLGIYERVVNPAPDLEPPQVDGPEIALAKPAARDPRVVLGPDGGWLALWHTGPSGRVVSRGFDATGKPRGPEVPLTLAGSAPNGYELALSALPDGRYVAAWVASSSDQPITVAWLGADGRLAGSTITAPSSQGARALDLATGSDGQFVLAWHRPQEFGEIQALRFRADGSPNEVAWKLTTSLGPADQLEIEPDPAGGYLVAWSEDEEKIYVLRLNQDAEQLTAPLLVSLDTARQGLPHVTPDVDGGFAVAWSAALLPASNFASAVRLRRFTREGFAREGVIEIQALQPNGEDDSRVLYAADLSSSREGILWVLLNRRELFGEGLLSGLAVIDGIPVGPPAVIAAEPPFGTDSLGDAQALADGCGWLVAWGATEAGQSLSKVRRVTGGCPEISEALPLNDGRFRAEVTWRTREGQSGTGRPLSLTDDTGAFWFFGPDNLELMLKVLDGRALNGAYWVFYATLTDVEFELRITDQWTGVQKVYAKPAGRLESHADVGAFPVGAALAAPSRTLRWKASETATADLKAGTCVPSETALCLLGQRFRVSVSFVNPLDRSERQALVRPLTADSGSFWFFAPDNLELMVKVVDGRPVNGHFWFFSAGLSDVNYRISVTDTQTGSTRVYTNPRGTLASRADTSAFSD